ncbi:MAG: abhydrolase domain-containing 18 [Acidobacteria bacterium]|nr:abhydrolase domain-containing 18 [Acidobacteriota bacterium]
MAARATDRVIREFDWGLEWTRGWPCTARIACDSHDPATYLRLLNEEALRDSSEFFAYRTPSDFRLEENLLRFTSAVATPYPENNTVYGQWFPARADCRRAVLVLPHWNAGFHQHVPLCRGLSRLGISALRLSLPYHDRRMPRELKRADYAVSASVARTIDAARQAVIDSRSCLDWLEIQGCERLGILGTSLGSCYAFLTSAHDERLRANVFNLFALYFADVVWTGLSTRHIRKGMDGRIELEQLREVWRVIAPFTYVDRFARYDKKSLFIYAACDTTFLPEYSLAMLDALRQRKVEHKAVALPCGHYTLGERPFKYLDGYHICSFLLASL